MYPLKYWFKIFKILFALSVDGETGTTKKVKETPTTKTTKPATLSQATIHTTTSAPSAPTPPVTTLSLSLDFPPLPTTSAVQTPSAQDVRVSWIYDLLKPELQAEMQKFGLETDGTCDELRRRFRDFLRQGFDPARIETLGGPSDNLNRSDQAELPISDESRNRDLIGIVPSTATTLAQCNPPTHDPEGASIREMLSLPPNADFKEVQRALSTLMIKRPETAFVPDFQTHTTQAVKQPTMSLAPQDKMLTPTLGQSWRAPRPTTDIGVVCNQVRKWGIRFDGTRDPVTFLERLNELVECYEIEHDALVKALPELFKSQALYWYRNNKDNWRSYEDFIQDFEIYFLPPDYRKNLEEEILRRTQAEQEPFRNFVVALQMLMRRLGPYSTNDLLNRLYKNMRPEYKLTIRREQFQTVNELIKLAEGHESYIREKKNYRPPPPPAQSLFPEASFTTKTRPHQSYKVDMIEAERQYDSPCNYPHTNMRNKDAGGKRYGHPNKPTSEPRSTLRTKAVQPPICWNCENVGHRFSECSLPRVIRCFNCKTVGVRTVKCSCSQGNGNGDQRKGGALSLPVQTSEPNPVSLPVQTPEPAPVSGSSGSHT